MVATSNPDTLARRLHGRRELDTQSDAVEYTTSDLQMIDRLDSADKPVKIKLCVGTTFSTSASTGNQFTNPDISGFQLFYGSNNISGPVHGETSSGCTEHAFPANHPIEVNLYAD